MVLYGRKRNYQAFEIVFHRYRTQLFGFFIRMTGNRSQAEDLYQETFLKVIRSAPAYKPKALFRTWLYVIARNTARDLMRKSKKDQKNKPLQSDDQKHLSNPENTLKSDLPGPDRNLISDQIKNTLIQSLQLLPLDQREMFLLREFAGMDFKNAARTAKCSENTAKSRMRYALLKLQDIFTQKGLHPGRNLSS